MVLGTALAEAFHMSMRTQAIQYGQRRLTRKLSRSIPWIGGLLALATLSAAVRRKGLFKGTLDTALDFTPFIGGVKNLAEMARGRDFIRDRRA
jgi:hypothetical protein